MAGAALKKVQGNGRTRGVLGRDGCSACAWWYHGVGLLLDITVDDTRTCGRRNILYLLPEEMVYMYVMCDDGDNDNLSLMG